VLTAVTLAAEAADHIEIREGVRLQGLLQDGAGRVCGVRAAGPEGAMEITPRGGADHRRHRRAVRRHHQSRRFCEARGWRWPRWPARQVADPEFVQFHPTAIDVGRDPAPLATEALRGEGALLVDREGRRIMADHPQGDLAPRDVVARALHARLEQGRGAFLDARTVVGDRFPEAFPAVFAACMGAGLDPRSELMPVAPAAHFHMGGIAVDAEGRTSLAGLYAGGRMRRRRRARRQPARLQRASGGCGFRARTGEAAARSVPGP
jgi:L-aspartate oxidase